MQGYSGVVGKGISSARPRMEIHYTVYRDLLWTGLDLQRRRRRRVLPRRLQPPTMIASATRDPAAAARVAQLLVPVDRPAFRRKVEQVPDGLEGADVAGFLPRIGRREKSSEPQKWRFVSPSRWNTFSIGVCAPLMVSAEVVAIVRVTGRREEP